MSLVALGTLTLGATIPGAAIAADAGSTGISAAIPNIDAQLTALAEFAPSPFNFAAQLSQANAILLSVNACIAAIPPLPTPPDATQIAAVAALVADLHANLTAVNAQLGTVLEFQTQLAVAGVRAYAYTGPGDYLGAALSSELSGYTGQTAGVVLLATTSAAWLAMQAVFKVTP